MSLPFGQALGGAGGAGLYTSHPRPVTGRHCHAALAGQPVYAFCGIANPQKFFATLQQAGALLAGRMPFNDHYPFDAGDLDQVLADAARLHARPVTTLKDFVRLPNAYRDRVTVVTVGLDWEDEAALDRLLAPVLAKR